MTEPHDASNAEHSIDVDLTDAEYVLIDSIEPRLYLAARLIMDISRGQVAGM